MKIIHWFFLWAPRENWLPAVVWEVQGFLVQVMTLPDGRSRTWPLTLSAYKNVFSPTGKSALHWAAAVNNVEATLLLLKNGANRDMQDNKVQSGPWAGGQVQQRLGLCVRPFLFSCSCSVGRTDNDGSRLSKKWVQRAWVLALGLSSEVSGLTLGLLSLHQAVPFITLV